MAYCTAGPQDNDCSLLIIVGALKCEPVLQCDLDGNWLGSSESFKIPIRFSPSCKISTGSLTKPSVSIMTVFVLSIKLRERQSPEQGRERSAGPDNHRTMEQG